MSKSIVTIIIVILCGSLQGFSQKNPDEIKEKITELSSAKNFTKKSIQYIDLLIDLGNALKFSKTDTVKSLAAETLDLSRLIHYQKGESESLLNFGYFELFTGNADKAIFYYKQTLREALSNEFKYIAVESYNGIAQAHFIKAEYPDAFENFLNGLELAEKIGNSELTIKMSTNLGTLFSLLTDYDEALKYYKLAQSKFNKSTTNINKAAVLVNLGYLNNKTNNPNQALRYLNESIAMLQEIQAIKILAFAYITKGDVYNRTERYNEALSFFNKANEIYDEVNDKKGEADLNYYTGISHNNLNNVKKAEASFLKSLNLYKSFNLKSGLEKSYRALYAINRDKESTSKALYFLELAQKYSDSLSKEQQRSNISMMNAKLSYAKDKMVLAELNKKEKRDINQYITWIIMSLISLILISILVIRATANKKRLNEELAIQTTVLSKKQEELNLINANQDKLFSIVGTNLKEPIISLKNLLETVLEKNKEIKQFYTLGPKLKKDVDDLHFTLDNILNWGLTQMKGSASKQETIFVKAHLLEIIDFFTEPLDKKHIAIKIAISDTLELNMDPNHFTLIFRNIISNAIKFSPENGSILIDTISNENYVTIKVSDNGTGIPIDIKTKIFDKKVHFTTTGTNNELGSGLGLSLCKELIEKNNGFITVESELGKGSIFSVNFVLTTVT